MGNGHVPCHPPQQATVEEDSQTHLPYYRAQTHAGTENVSVIRNEERGQVIGGGGKGLEGEARDWRGR